MKAVLKLFSLNFIKLVFMPLRSAALHIYAVFSRFGFQRVAALYAMLPFFTVPIKIFFYHVDVNGQRFTASGITCAGQKKFSALALYQFHRSAAAWTFFACPHVAGKSVGVRFFVCIGVYGCALIRCSAHLWKSVERFRCACPLCKCVRSTRKAGYIFCAFL